ncbi:MAG: hypothetical protein AB7N76_06715 [Planctomycetota bacterium]
MHPPGVTPGGGPLGLGLPTPEPPAPSRAKQVRVALLLLVLLGAGLQYLRVKAAESWRPDWEGGRERVTVRVIVPKGLSADEEALVAHLKEYAFLGDGFASFTALSDWLKREQGRYRSVPSTAPVAFKVQGPLEAATLPPTPPRADEGLSFLERWRRSRDFLAWFQAIAAQDPADAPNSVFVVFYRKAEAPWLDKVHSVADRRSRSGFVFARLDEDGVQSAVIDVGHELLHLFGAKDEYEGLRCNYPEGFVEPFAEPRYPQRFAEVMALGIPRGEGQREGGLHSFEQMRVGVQTAFEIGWIDQARRDRYYKGDASAAPTFD